MNRKRQGACAALLAVSFLFGSAIAARADYLEGLKAFRAGDMNRAEEEFKFEVETAPNYDFGWYMLGMISLKKADYPQAEQHLQKAIELSPNKFSYYNGLANLYAAQKEYVRAVELLLERQGLAETGREILTLNQALGFNSVRLGNHQDAVVYLEKAKTNPPNLEVFSQLGRSYIILRDYDKAIAILKTALAVDPDNVSMLQLLGNSIITKAQSVKTDAAKMALYDEVIPYARKLVLLAGDDYLNHNLLGRALFGARRYSDSIASFGKVLELKPDYCFAYSNIGKVYLTQDQPEIAERNLRDGLKCDPKNHVTWELLGSTLEKLSRHDDSLQAFQEARNIKETSVNQEGITRISAIITNRNLDSEQERLDREADEQYQRELAAFEKQQKALDEYYKKDNKKEEGGEQEEGSEESGDEGSEESGGEGNEED